MTRPLFLVWLRRSDGVPMPQLVFEADKSGSAPLLTKAEADARICWFAIAPELAHLPFGDLTSEYFWKKAKAA